MDLSPPCVIVNIMATNGEAPRCCISLSTSRGAFYVPSRVYLSDKLLIIAYVLWGLLPVPIMLWVQMFVWNLLVGLDVYEGGMLLGPLEVFSAWSAFCLVRWVCLI